MAFEPHKPAIVMERKLTVGNVINVLVVLVTMGITWGVFTTQSETMGRDLALVSDSVKVLQDARYGDNARMVRVETLLEQILDAVER